MLHAVCCRGPLLFLGLLVVAGTAGVLWGLAALAAAVALAVVVATVRRRRRRRGPACPSCGPPASLESANGSGNDVVDPQLPSARAGQASGDEALAP